MGIKHKSGRKAIALARSNNAAINSNNIAIMRNGLLCTVAAGALLFTNLDQTHAQVVPGSPQCGVAGTTVTCTGDLSTGVTVIGPAYDTLNVNNVNVPGITPAAGTDGIIFITLGGNNVTINADTSGTAGISTMGDFAEGIFGFVVGDGDVTTISTGDISTMGGSADGIFGFVVGDGDVTTISTGDVSTMGGSADGISSIVVGDGDVTTISTGDVSTMGGSADGISSIVGGDGDVTSTSTGSITTMGNDADGIFGYAYNGNVTINSTGNISTMGDGSEGIYTRAQGNGDINITSNGDITTTGPNAEGIYSRVFGNGNVITTNTGNISTMGVNGDGIYGLVDGNGNVVITNTGNITSATEEGIDATIMAGGNIDITSSGNLISTNGAGIDAYTTMGNVTISSNGNINSFDEGIYGYVGGGGNGNITINSTGNVTASDNGLDAFVSGNGDIIITSTGNIMSDTFGIYGEVESSGDVTISSMGNVTTAGGIGIFGLVDSGNGNVTTTNIGNITTMGCCSSGIAGVVGLGDGNVMTTSTGNISTMGDDAEGIFSYVYGNGNITTTSTGNISTAGNGAQGIYGYVYGNGNVTTNSIGNITTTGTVGGTDGILGSVYGNGNVTTTSTGNISTASNGAQGIYGYVYGNGNVTTNSIGNISTTGDGAHGILGYVYGNGNVAINSAGNISTMGLFSPEGILGAVQGDGNVTINSNGNVTSANAAGIQANADGTGSINIQTAGMVSGTTGIEVLIRDMMAASTITNSGAITGTGGTAIDFRGDGNDVLNLLPGSVINGAIDFGNGNDNMGGTNVNDIDTLNIGAGVNTILTFADTGGTGQGDNDLQSAPEIINLAGVGVLAGNTLVAFDPTGFAASGVFAEGLSSTLFDILNNNKGNGIESGTSTHASTHDNDGVSEDVYGGNRYWLSGFGGHHSVEGSGSLTDFSNSFGGAVTGIERTTGEGVFGLLAGGARSNINVEFNTQDIEIDSVFGGAYWKQDYGSHRIHFAFVGGSADHHSERRVGAATALADYDGWFISPSLTLAAPAQMFDTPVEASVRVNYTGLFLDGYTETGTGAPLTVGDRDVHLFGTRAQINLPQITLQEDGSHTHIDWRLGVDAQFNLGSDNVTASALGTPFSFTADSDDEISGFTGVSFTHTSADGMKAFTLSGEIQSPFDGGYEATGEARVSFRF